MAIEHQGENPELMKPSHSGKMLQLRYIYYITKPHGHYSSIAV